MIKSNFSNEEIIAFGKETTRIEAKEIQLLENKIDSNFALAIQTILSSDGRLILTGIGKSAIIAQKIVATLNSTGTPSIYMHAADAVHGDLGIIQRNDIVIAISKSGETPEIKVLAPLLKQSGNTLIAMVGNVHSFLAKQANIVLDVSVDKEACPHNLAPTSSTTTQLVMGDAIAVTLLNCKKFTADDFAKYHPGGALGKKLYLRIKDIISPLKPQVNEHSSLIEVINSISSGRMGATVVVHKNEIRGIITDGDLRRLLEKTSDLNDVCAKDFMNTNPKLIDINTMASEALDIIRESKISQLLVVSKNEYEGLIHIHDLNREGIF